MKIASVDIQNFRKLKQCHIDFSDTTTLFVGANNSGKTSAMDALGKFLSQRRLAYNDITLSNHAKINEIGTLWEMEESVKPDSIIDWECILPTLDIWLCVSESEIHYISHIIPTLDWRGGVLGVRFMCQPIDIGNMFVEYRELFATARETEAANPDMLLKLWPKCLCDFLDRRLATLFTLKAYILDPGKVKNDPPQKTAFDMECFEQNPLEGLVHIDMISAQRGFSDPESNEKKSDNFSSGSLSSQLRSYYDKHLDPEKSPTSEDFGALQALESAKVIFDNNLREKFNTAIKELETLGYPGVNDPKITITAKVSATETLNHDSAVQYSLTNEPSNGLVLPEKYNGLGYQNLISMVFQLMRFRDDWMQEGKAKQHGVIKPIEPLHLVLLEEPEAHLHIQVQQVFINKAYGVLRNHAFLQSHPDFLTQLVISSHSSHIAREVSFANLRYFKRLPAISDCTIPTTKVINLSDVFGKGNATDRFVTRYLQSSHCDLFFADAAILVEGSAEIMLVPHFIRNNYDELSKRYITILGINGRHTHRLRPLIEKLCITTLIITDIDSASPVGNHKSVYPERNKGYITGNFAISNWLAKGRALDTLLDLRSEEKEVRCNSPYCYSIKFAYQTPVDVNFRDEEHIEAISSTFEDCLVHTNLGYFMSVKGIGLVNSVHDLVKSSKDFKELHKKLYDELRKSESKKASFALDMIYSMDPESLKTPPYIAEGLDWLQTQLRTHE